MKKLQIILPLALIICFMVGCQDREAMAELEAMKAQAEVEEQNKALATRYNEAWESGDLEAVKKIFSPDFVFHSQSGQDNSLEDTIYALKQHMVTWPDRTFSVEDMSTKLGEVHQGTAPISRSSIISRMTILTINTSQTGVSERHSDTPRP